MEDVNVNAVVRSLEVGFDKHVISSPAGPAGGGSLASSSHSTDRNHLPLLIMANLLYALISRGLGGGPEDIRSAVEQADQAVTAHDGCADDDDIVASVRRAMHGQAVNLCGCSLRGMPCAVTTLIGIASLTLRDNQLQQWPELSSLVSLRELDLGGNELVSVPAQSGLGALTSLTRLILDGNRISTIDDVFADLRLLQSLNLAHNNLTALPAGVSMCRAVARAL